MSGAERALFYLNFGAELILLAQLIRYKLYIPYRSLFFYWLVQCVATVLILPVPMLTYRYLYMYWGAQTLFILMAVFIVQDLYKIALREHPNLASVARRSVIGAMAVAAVVALSGTNLDSAIRPGQYPAIHHFARFERTMDCVILVFLLVISILLLWFPIRVRRNIVVYIFGFVVFWAARCIGLLLSNLLPPEDTRLVSTILMAITLFCLVIWIAGIQPEGERVLATAGYARNPETMERLSRQLDAINSALTRYVRH